MDDDRLINREDMSFGFEVWKVMPLLQIFLQNVFMNLFM